jgi:elongator complex protein 3
MRDMPCKFIVAGCKDLALRSAIKKRMEEVGVECQCIRCREYGHRLRDRRKIEEPRLARLDYKASAGQEVFLSFEDEGGTIFGLLRMRTGSLAVGDGKLAMVRELHVFGSEVPLGEKDAGAAQHKGMGLQLLKEAERIARDEFKATRVAIISGVGAREYFRSECGYELDGDYMTKGL